MKLALTGLAYTGKTSLANYIVESQHGHLLDYTGLLKRYAAEIIRDLSAVDSLMTPLEVADTLLLRAGKQMPPILYGQGAEFGVGAMALKYELRSGAEQVDTAMINAEKWRYRGFLQCLGSCLEFDKGFGVDRVLEEWRQAGAKEPAVFDNVRFVEQLAPLTQAAFGLVRLTLSEPEIMARAERLGVGSLRLAQERAHVADQGIPPQPGEIVLDGSTSTAAIAEMLKGTDLSL